MFPTAEPITWMWMLLRMRVFESAYPLNSVDDHGNPYVILLFCIFRVVGCRIRFCCIVKEDFAVRIAGQNKKDVFEKNEVFDVFHVEPKGFSH